MSAATSFIQTVFGSCTSPFPSSSDSSSRYASRELLVVHKFDRPMKCMIEPTEVVRMIKYQDEEISRQERQKQKYQIDHPLRTLKVSDRQGVKNDSWDVESSVLGSDFSTEAKTNITTTTDVTQVITNQRKIWKKHEYKAWDSSQEAGWTPESLDDYLLDDSFMHPEIQKSEVYGKNLKLQSPVVQSLLKGCRRVMISDGACRKEIEYRRALYLKMKADVGQYFTATANGTFLNTHLSRFNFLNRIPSISTIERSFTDSSLSGYCVNYGVNIHSSPIYFKVDDSCFMDLAISGSLGLVKRFEVNRSGQRLKSPNYYKVLLNRRSEIPLAVCALKSPQGPPVVRIYSIKERVVNQMPVTTTTQLGITWCDKYPLYTWAEFIAEGEFPGDVQYLIYLSKGPNGSFEKEPSYRAFHPNIGSPDILVMGKTENELHLQGCASISLETNSNESNYTVTIARGIDPAFILCLASIVDEVTENSIRKAYKSSS
jgi:hypothetical protein